MTSQTVHRNRSPLGRAVAFAACMLSGTLGVAAAATPADEPPAVVVAYGDLDLGTDNGVHALYNRIAAAASRVCPPEDGRDLKRFFAFKSCREAAIARAVSEIKSPQLAALRDEHAKRG